MARTKTDDTTQINITPACSKHQGSIPDSTVYPRYDLSKSQFCVAIQRLTTRFRGRGAFAARRSRSAPAAAPQRAHLKLCVSVEPKIAIHGHPGGAQWPFRNPAEQPQVPQTTAGMSGTRELHAPHVHVRGRAANRAGMSGAGARTAALIHPWGAQNHRFDCQNQPRRDSTMSVIQLPK